MKSQIQDMLTYNNEQIEHLKNSKMSLIKQGIIPNITQTVMFPQTQSRFNKIPEAEDAEIDMIDMAFEPKKNSRLSCQIIVSDDLEGFTVTTPEKQS